MPVLKKKKSISVRATEKDFKGLGNGYTYYRK